MCTHTHPYVHEWLIDWAGGGAEASVLIRRDTRSCASSQPNLFNRYSVNLVMHGVKTLRFRSCHVVVVLCLCIESRNGNLSSLFGANLRIWCDEDSIGSHPSRVSPRNRQRGIVFGQYRFHSVKITYVDKVEFTVFPRIQWLCFATNNSNFLCRFIMFKNKINCELRMFCNTF